MNMSRRNFNHEAYERGNYNHEPHERGGRNFNHEKHEKILSCRSCFSWLILFVLGIAAFSFAGCDFIEDLFHPGRDDPPPPIPVAHWDKVKQDITVPFTVTWEDPSIAPDDDELWIALSKFHDEWQRYTVVLFDTLPHAYKHDVYLQDSQFGWPLRGQAKGLDDAAYRDYLTFSTNKDGMPAVNSGARAVILKRWWPKYRPQTRTEWMSTGSLELRMREFAKARNGMLAIIKQLKASPYYEWQFDNGLGDGGTVDSPIKRAVVGYPGTDESPWLGLVGLEPFVAAPDVGVKRMDFGYLMSNLFGGTELSGQPALPAGIGQLYEAFFGYVPLASECGGHGPYPD